MAKEYRPEFFDRDYTMREAYPRIWKYARPYLGRIVLGLLCGLVVAGVLVPCYQVIQPTVAFAGNEQGARPSSPAVASPKPVEREAVAPKPRNKFDKTMAKAAKLPGWYYDLERFAGKFGIRFTDEAGHMQGAMLFLVLVCVPLAMFVKLLFEYLNKYCLSWAAAKAVADLRCDMLRHVQNQSMQFFGRVDMGQLMMRINGDPQQLRLLLTTVLSELAIAPFVIFVSVGFVIHFALANDMAYLVGLLALGLPLFFGPIFLLGRRLRKWAKRMLRQSTVVGSKLHETLTCMKQVKAYHAEAREAESFRETYRTQLKMILRALRIGLMVSPTVEAVGLVTVAAFVIWCCFFSVPLSRILPMLAPLLVVYTPIKELSKLQVQLQESMAALSRIFATLDVHMELPVAAHPVKKTSFDDAIVFDHVSFRYENASRDAVHDVSFAVRRGQFVAVVGATGSGKTTLSALLARFYDPSAGSVTMDGVPLAEIDNASLRSLVGAVLQESLLFNDTVAANVAYGSPGATPADVERAAALANADGFVKAHPDGYRRVVGDKGGNLSGGERQRLAIARAILKDPPVLILDEATSALDTVTERLVQEALGRLRANRTVFAIAHRLSTIRHADLILVMRDGEIVERGTHDSLYAADGVYRRLCDMQRRSAPEEDACNAR